MGQEGERDVLSEIIHVVITVAGVIIVFVDWVNSPPTEPAPHPPRRDSSWDDNFIDLGTNHEEMPKVDDDWMDCSPD